MADKLLSYLPFSTDLAALLLRLTFGGLFMRVGYMKLASFPEMVQMFPDPIGIGARLSLVLVIFAELFCGFLVTIGLLTRLAVIPIFITMIVVFFIVHAKDPFDAKSLLFVYGLLSVVIFVLGSGAFSADRAFIRPKRRW